MKKPDKAQRERESLGRWFLNMEIQSEPNKTVTASVRERETSGVCSNAMKQLKYSFYSHI